MLIRPWDGSLERRGRGQDAGSVTAPAAEPRVRRPVLLLGMVVAAGLAVHLGIGGRVGDKAGDVLYAAMVYLLVVVLRPRCSWRVALAVAVSWCFAVEFLQLSDLPRRASEVFPPAALALGSGFDGWDLPAYVVGAAAGAVVVGARWRPRKLPAR